MESVKAGNAARERDTCVRLSLLNVTVFRPFPVGEPPSLTDDQPVLYSFLQSRLLHQRRAHGHQRPPAPIPYQIRCDAGRRHLVTRYLPMPQVPQDLQVVPRTAQAPRVRVRQDAALQVPALCLHRQASLARLLTHQEQSL